MSPLYFSNVLELKLNLRAFYLWLLLPLVAIALDASCAQASNLAELLATEEQVDFGTEGDMRSTGEVIFVGPGEEYEEPHLVPLSKLGTGEEPRKTVAIKCRTAAQGGAYHSRLVINRSGTGNTRRDRITIVGINCSDGSRPIIDGDWAKTNADASFFSTGQYGVDHYGVILIVPGNYTQYGDDYVEYITIANLDIRNGAENNKFYDTYGKDWWYPSQSACIHTYRSRNVLLKNNDLHNCWTGVFAMSQGEQNHIVQDLVLDGNIIRDQGIPGKYYYHGTYIEANRAVYTRNTYLDQKPGMAGAALKDRSAGAVILHNYIRGTLRALDLVDPESGGYPLKYLSSSWGMTLVAGNVILSPSYASAPIHFGFDGDEEYCQPLLELVGNTFVITPDQWKTALLKLDNCSDVELKGNIMYLAAPTQAVNFAWTGYGSGVPIISFAENMFPPQGMIFNDYMHEIYGKENIKYKDPLFGNPANGEYCLKPESPAVGAMNQTGYMSQYLSWLYRQYGYGEPKQFNVGPRPTKYNLGGIEEICGTKNAPDGNGKDKKAKKPKKPKPPKKPKKPKAPKKPKKGK